MKSVELSVVIPVLNAERDLVGCLDSIRRQGKHPDQYEIVVVDGGSSDATRHVAHLAGARVIDNPYYKAEPGVAVGMQGSRGEFITVMAADNRMHGVNFMDQILAPFENPNVVAAFPRLISTVEDGLVNRYVNRYSDPFNHFVYGSLNTSMDVMLRHGEYVLDRTSRTHPLLAVAQGCTVRAGLVYKGPPEQADDVLAILQLIEAGGKLALVEGAELEHHHVGGLSALYKKYWRRTRDSLRGEQGFLRRESYLTRGRQIRRWLWVPYSASIVLPAVHGAMLALRHRDPVLLFHPVVNTVVFVAVVRGGAAHVLTPADGSEKLIR
jgi:glycosyltransferase involved in cell wall biosynthesis